MEKIKISCQYQDSRQWLTPDWRWHGVGDAPDRAPCLEQRRGSCRCAVADEFLQQPT